MLRAARTASAPACAVKKLPTPQRGNDRSDSSECAGGEPATGALTTVYLRCRAEADVRFGGAYGGHRGRVGGRSHRGGRRTWRRGRAGSQVGRPLIRMPSTDCARVTAHVHRRLLRKHHFRQRQPLQLGRHFQRRIRPGQRGAARHLVRVDPVDKGGVRPGSLDLTPGRVLGFDGASLL